METTCIITGGWNDSRCCHYGRQMREKRHYMILWTAGAVLLAALFAADMMTGSAGIRAADVWKAMTGGDVPEQTRLIVMQIRLPKTVTALLAGMAVSVSGLLMQTLFRNPLAGPYVLGISSGASLGAALCVLGTSASAALAGSSVLAAAGMAGAAWAGAAAVLGIIALASRKIGDITVILILGMMLGAGIDAVVQVLQFISDEQSLKAYVMWTMGSLGNVSGVRLWLLAAAVLAGTGMAAVSCKPLNLLLLGEGYAASCGTDVRRVRLTVYAATVLLAGTVTAFCGPVGFIGLAVPHLARLAAGNADHRVLIPAALLCGGVLMMSCDIIARAAAIPINAVTSLAGIPVVIWIILRHRR